MNHLKKLIFFYDNIRMEIKSVILIKREKDIENVKDKSSHILFIILCNGDSYRRHCKLFLRNETSVDVNRCVYCIPRSKQTSVKESKGRNEFIKGCEVYKHYDRVTYLYISHPTSYHIICKRCCVNSPAVEEQTIVIRQMTLNRSRKTTYLQQKQNMKCLGVHKQKGNNWHTNRGRWSSKWRSAHQFH